MDACRLDYEPNTTARPVILEREAGLMRVVVPMGRPYTPVSPWIGDLGLLSLVLGPARRKG